MQSLPLFCWNQDNFQSLAKLANLLEQDTQLALLASYCRLREEGRRKEAFQALEGFLDKVKTLSLERRYQIANEILEAKETLPQAHQFMSQPLWERLIKPTINQYLDKNPDCLSALRWHGIYSNSSKSLRKLLELDPSDHLARRTFIVRWFLQEVDFATHHINEGLLLARLPDIEEWLDEADKLLAGAPDSSEIIDLEGEINEYRQLISDWRQYQKSDFSSFPAWCIRHGRHYTWHKKFAKK
ncbi:MAG: hypothetical protein AAF530_19505 [Pseudomonadota bacterium]